MAAICSNAAPGHGKLGLDLLLRPKLPELGFRTPQQLGRPFREQLQVQDELTLAGLEAQRLLCADFLPVAGTTWAIDETVTVPLLQHFLVKARTLPDNHLRRYNQHAWAVQSVRGELRYAPPREALALFAFPLRSFDSDARSARVLC